jgi:hypothetical protein
MRVMSKISILCSVVLLGLGLNYGASAANFSFTGSFAQDDDVQLFNFSVGAPSNVTLETLSYAGGLNAAGDLIARGGFDPILALFDSGGNLIGQNDDGGPSLVATDLSGQAWDTFFTALLAAGNYTVAIMQYNNFANGPTLADGFQRSGQGNFTDPSCAASSFCDVSGSAFNQRDGHWAFDILNVESASSSVVPLPAALPLLAGGLGLMGWMARRRRGQAAHA